VKPPSSSNATNQLLQQYATNNAISQQQQDAFSQQLAANQATSQATVNSAVSTITARTAGAATKPVDFKTILTSPQGLLGNPLLSNAKLG
jgi:hypothetical protein